MSFFLLSLSGIGGTISSALLSWGFWLVMLVVLFAVIFGSIWMRKKGKFTFPCIIFSDNGNGKVGIRFSRAGWFKSKKILGGMIDISGERRLEVKDGRMVQQGSSSDFHELGFKAGLLLQEKPDDPKVLVPIKKCQLDINSQKMINAIAPADYRDACSKIISDAEKEGIANWANMAQILVFGFVAMVLFISIILVIQYSKNAMTEANQIHKEALAFYDKVLSRTSVAPATNAP